jgi:hypothetical protein
MYSRLVMCSEYQCRELGLFWTHFVILFRWISHSLCLLTIHAFGINFCESDSLTCLGLGETPKNKNCNNSEMVNTLLIITYVIDLRLRYLVDVFVAIGCGWSSQLGLVLDDPWKHKCIRGQTLRMVKIMQEWWLKNDIFLNANDVTTSSKGIFSC